MTMRAGTMTGRPAHCGHLAAPATSRRRVPAGPSRPAADNGPRYRAQGAERPERTAGEPGTRNAATAGRQRQPNCIPRDGRDARGTDLRPAKQRTGNEQCGPARPVSLTMMTDARARRVPAMSSGAARGVTARPSGREETARAAWAGGRPAARGRARVQAARQAGMARAGKQTSIDEDRHAGAARAAGRGKNARAVTAGRTDSKHSHSGNRRSAQVMTRTASRGGSPRITPLPSHRPHETRGNYHLDATEDGNLAARWHDAGRPGCRLVACRTIAALFVHAPSPGQMPLPHYNSRAYFPPAASAGQVVIQTT